MTEAARLGRRDGSPKCDPAISQNVSWRNNCIETVETGRGCTIFMPGNDVRVDVGKNHHISVRDLSRDTLPKCPL